MNCWCALLEALLQKALFLLHHQDTASFIRFLAFIPYQTSTNPRSYDDLQSVEAWLYPYGMLLSRGLIRYRTRVLYQTLRKGGGHAARPTPRLIYIDVLTQGHFIDYVTPHNLVKNINMNASISFPYNSRQNPNLTAGFFFPSSTLDEEG